MIKRIRVVKQVGVFSDFVSGNDKELRQLTVLFGLNTAGKTTLCDILTAAGKDDPETIERRRTIGATSAAPQEVVLSVLDSSTGTEHNVTFSRGQWSSSELKGRIDVFDTSFVHRNVFDGLTLLGDRTTKENFTDFILGERGVTIARELEESRRKARKLRSELKALVPPFVAGQTEAEIQAFVDMKSSPGMTLGDLDTALQKLRSQAAGLRSDIVEKDLILGLAEPAPVTDDEVRSIGDAVRRMEERLALTFTGVTEEAVNRLRNHIRTALGDDERSEGWIRQGLAMNTSDSCPFCGRSLAECADLIGVYHSYFTNAYLAFVQATTTDLRGAYRETEAAISVDGRIADMVLLSSKYDASKVGQGFSGLMSSLDEIRSSVRESCSQLRQSLAATRHQLESAIEQKTLRPHEAIRVDTADLQRLLDNTADDTARANELIGHIVNAVTSYKAQFRSTAAQETLRRIEHDITQMERQHARIAEADACEAYVQMKAKIALIEAEIARLTSELEEQQESYLGQCFANIHAYFAALGGRDYGIERSRSSNRGDKRVYGITVRYRGTAVAETAFPFVFSDSDRRALALSVFWARLKCMPPDELSSRIIVLDDPVTSFDDNRLIKHNDIVWQFKDEVNQVILLTHYPVFVKELRGRGICDTASSFLLIRQEALTSCIDHLDVDMFCSCEMEQQFAAISDFVKRKRTDDVRRNLRPYFENRIRELYLKPLIDLGLSRRKLQEQIEGLFESGIIDSELCERLQHYREELNPEQHVLTTNNAEDVRHFAEELLSFLFGVQLTIPAV